MIAVQHLAEIIKNEQNKQHGIVMVLVQLHIHYAREKQRLHLYLDKQLKKHLKAFQDQQEKLNEENRRGH